MAKLKPREDGRYQRSIVDKHTKKRVYFYGNSEREVNQQLLEYQRCEEYGRRFKTVADEWWSLESNMLSPSTVRGYLKAKERVITEFGHLHIQDIKTADISRFLYALGKRQGMAKKTVKNHKIILNRIFHFAVVQGDIQYNPSREAEIPRGLTYTPRRPARADEEAVVAQASEVWLLPFMALFTGMRKGELRGVMWGDIDWDRKLIHVQRSVWDGGGTHIKTPKTKAGDRLIPIVDVLYKELEKHRADDDHYIFGDENPITEKKYRYLYYKFQKETGITATVQQLRKSYATMAAGANIPEDVFAAIFGHEDITTTLNIYAEVRPSRIMAARQLLNAQKYTQQIEDS